MREIKFRAWDKKRNEMLTDIEFIRFSKNGFPIGVKVWGYEYRDIGRGLNELVPLQYTGLKDKNGTGDELYEADLITNPSRNGGKPHPIIWSEKYGGWCGDYGIEYLIAPELYEITKRGNIYENPELLEAK